MAYDTRAFGDFGWAFVNAGKHQEEVFVPGRSDKLTTSIEEN